ncbi:hypothetical protein HUU05_18200 [candidate division KSB1 bacterium]|nr:hypothetical protein [candidate division KSB1 bacterium]
MSSLAYSLRVRFRRIEPEKLWTYIITSVILLAIYIYLGTLHWEEPRFDVEKIAEIDFKKYEPPKPKAERKIVEKPTEIPKENLEVVPNQPVDFEQIDMSKLTELTKTTQMMQEDFSVLNRIASSPNALPEVNVGVTNLPKFDVPVVASTASDAIPVAGAASNVYNPSLKSAKVGYGGVGGPAYSTGKLGPAADRTQSGTVTNKVTVKDFEKARESIDFNQLFRELIEWMKANQHPLPEVLKHYMRHRSGDLTSKVTIEVPPSVYELFLLANEQSQDIGLLLVLKSDNSQAILLRDTGFRKKSFSLHEGVAGLEDESKSVISLSMSEENPSKEETSRFYNIFLSWWDKNKPQSAKQP